MENNLFEILKLNKNIAPLCDKRGPFVVDDTLGVSLLVATTFNLNKGHYNVIATNLYNAQRIYDLLSSFIGEENCLFFPVDEMLRSETLSVSKEMLAQRLFVMNELTTKKDYVLICHSASLLRFLPAPTLFNNSLFKFKVGQTYNIEDIKNRLVSEGYIKVNKIDQSMQFANRGDILDIYSVNNSKPIRLEFFDNELESIRYFDIATQRSIERLDECSILPSNDIILNEEEKGKVAEKLLKRFDHDKTIINHEYVDGLESITKVVIDNFNNNNINENMYKYYGYIQDTHYNILDYSTNSINIVTNKDGLENSANLLHQEVNDYFLELFEKGRGLSGLDLYGNLVDSLGLHKTIYCYPFARGNEETVFNARSIVGGSNNINGALNLINSYLETSKKLIICLASDQQRKSIEYILDEAEIKYEETTNLDLPSKTNIGLSIFNLDNGFELLDSGITVLTARELLGFHSKTTRFTNRYKSAEILKNYTDLVPGDYIVHEQYGIGKFLDIKTLYDKGVHRDYLHIQYAGSDVLYVPVEQFKLIRKYIGREGAAPKLNKLSSKDWEKTKARIKERVNDIADKLIALYAERARAEGFAFKEDDDFQRAFENQFPFELTDGQIEAVKEIKEDMEKPVPMDRLLCGDVGFGKTEVAFRAAFKAINSGKQVALLCPTTLLARQHYERAQERFANFGIKLAIFSRLIPEVQQKAYMEGLKNGSIHMAIGTHRLLSKEIKFKDLGLLIVDEEQRFGVEQKERIKELKTNVDVLTLSATPIPRTLQMSLVGIRNLSQLNTAPMNRMPIQTYVIPQNEDVVKELVERELSRKGQVFYVHNVVDTIYSKATKIQNMVPSASIAVVHGQMAKEEIEDTMMRFYNGEVDVLVCTSIIETGLDVSNANMIIIEDADKFGLAQLYQIKGRVGRGNQIAYAYLMYQPHKQLNEIAQKRLKAIQEFTELGSGYKIAQRDLMIRGAGDILGAEQAGFIDTVGIDMYIELLNEVIDEKQNGKKELFNNQPKKILNIDAYIPSEYATKGDKVELYIEIEKAKSLDELLDLENKIKDIYGSIPNEVEKLFTKKRIDIYQEEYWFKEFIEYPDHILLKCSQDFSNIDGMGYIIFKELQKYLLILKATYTERCMNLSINKKGDWFKSYEDINRIIYNLALKYKDQF